MEDQIAGALGEAIDLFMQLEDEQERRREKAMKHKIILEQALRKNE